MLKVFLTFDKVQLIKAILNASRELVIKKAESCRCPVHKKPPSINTVKNESSTGFSLEINGCCEQLMEEVKKKLGV